eukprot:CAMPEP_0174714668 /NCGR_PEP_ID=MMETSP1094-20130205/18652_1 /TAXON_ID=156173 /ORGANISM="Chrysochromulina brevifilum, Strain UTEX LB 985" /LENGTH=161 /DNA_ID=CAMNT_0015914069 /DNA_START=141 /DNA_END=627 /DNA_ORIENTATION=+
MGVQTRREPTHEPAILLGGVPVPRTPQSASAQKISCLKLGQVFELLVAIQSAKAYQKPIRGCLSHTASLWRLPSMSVQRTLLWPGSPFASASLSTLASADSRSIFVCSMATYASMWSASGTSGFRCRDASALEMKTATSSMALGCQVGASRGLMTVSRADA